MTSEANHRQRWFAATTVAAAAMVGVWLIAAPSPAVAQFGGQGSPDGFNPFRIFGPLFQRPQREPRDYRDPRDYRGPRDYRERYGPRERRAAPADHTKPPPPQKRDAEPSRHIVVMGASLSDWLAYGLEEIYSDQPEIGIVRKNHLLTGLVRFDSKDETTWPQVAREFLKDQNPDVIVVLLGLEDRQTMRVAVRDTEKQEQKRQEDSPPAPRPSRKTQVLEFRTDQWAEEYTRRVDEMIAALKSKGAPVIWVGLPAIRGTRSTSDMIYLNDLFRARAERAGIVYVDIWDGFVGENGRYATFGPDVEGQVRRLRTSEGVYFTKSGARKLAHYVERDIKRVMGTRLQPMAIPLDESGQPGASGPAARPVAGPVVSLTNTTGANELLGGSARPAATDPLAEQVLVKGAAVMPPSGRADNFFLSPEAAEAAKVAATPLEQVEPTAPATVAAVPPEAVAAMPDPTATVEEPKVGDVDGPDSEKKPAPGADTSPATPPRASSSRRPAARSVDRRVQPQSRPSAQERLVPPRDVGPYQQRRRQPTFDPFGLFR